MASKGFFWAGKKFRMAFGEKETEEFSTVWKCPLRKLKVIGSRLSFARTTGTFFWGGGGGQKKEICGYKRSSHGCDETILQRLYLQIISYQQGQPHQELKSKSSSHPLV